MRLANLRQSSRAMTIAVSFALLSACQQEPEHVEEISQRGADESLTFDHGDRRYSASAPTPRMADVRAAFRDRLALGRREIILPDSAETRALAETRGHSAVSVATALAHVSTAEDPGAYAVDWDRNRGFFYMRSREFEESAAGSASPVSSAGEVAVSDGELEEAALAIMESLGAEATELDMVVGGLLAVGGPSAELSQSILVSKKVYARRVILGVPVRRERITHTFDLEGDYQKSIGWWHEIDFESSALTSTLSATEIEDLAVDLLIAKGLAVQGLPIDIGTRFVVEESAAGDKHILRLVGYVVVHTEVAESDAEGKPTEFEFEISEE